MNRKFVAISIGILFVLSLNSVAASNEREPEIRINEINEGEPAVPFKVPNIFNYNEYYMLENFTGKLIMLDLMAEWCGPCNEAMPEMKQLYEVFAGSGLFEILSVSVSDSDTQGALESFHARHGVTWPMGWDLDHSVWEDYQSVGSFIPTYYLISADGLTVEYYEVGWAGFDFYFDKVAGLLEETDDTAPVINEFAEPLSNESFSIDNNSFDIAVNVTDNWSIKSVSVEVSIEEYTESFDLIYDTSVGLWTKGITFDLPSLYNAQTVELKYQASDYFDNTVISTAQSYPVEFIEDVEDPSLTNFKPRHEYDDESFVMVSVDAHDNYEIKKVELIEITVSTTTKYPFIYAFGPIWKISVEYDIELDITSYTYMVIATDIAGNTYNESLDFELFAPIPTTTTLETNSTIPLDTDTEPAPTPLSPFIFAIIAIPLLRKRKSNC